MKIIERKYLQDIIDVMGTPDIKVITGVRRSGKSELLHMFKEYIKKNDEKSNIIYIDFNLYEFDSIKDYKELINYIDNKYISNKNNYIIIDEVQMCTNFENAINNFHAEGKYDIYITGSNAFLLSSDLETLFTGRTYCIEVYPFSYKEFLEYYELDNNDNNFDRYIY